ncbi:MAG: phytoene desaturase family protein [Candidatus Omnitrophota bacterium]|jgi:phytoene desaturase
MGKKIAVVGAGVGGLAAAARLASRGHEVVVFEKLPECGGRAHCIVDKGFTFDTGPSFILMPDLFEEVFTYCGQKMADYLDLKVLETNYKIFYPDNDSLTVYRDLERTKLELERIEKGSASQYVRLLEDLGKLDSAIRPLLYQCLGVHDIFRPDYWRLAGKMKLFRTYWQLAKQYFKDEKLCYAFTFEAMFIGVSPFQAPAFYSVITYAGHIQHIAYPQGGIYQVPLALERLARRFGAAFQYSTCVQSIKKSGKNIILEFDNRQEVFEHVVVNADYAYTQSSLLGRPLPDYKYSCSVYLMYLGLKDMVKGLHHHNLFFSENLRENLDQIFKENTFPTDPSFYVHVPTVTDHTLAPFGKDLLHIMVPVANLRHEKNDFKAYEETLRKKVFKKLNQVTGCNIEDLIEVEHRFYPNDFIERYNIKYGAAFGLSHNLMQSAFFRPQNYDRSIEGLYYVGASTQPGGGLPVVIAGSRIVADLIEKKK